jgi:hypothetical protein
MKNYKLFIVMAMVLVLVGTASVSRKKKDVVAERKTVIKLSDDPVKNQRQILEELNIIKENQAKILENQTRIMNDTKLIRALQP